MRTHTDHREVTVPTVGERGDGWTKAGALSGVLFTVLLVAGTALSSGLPPTNSSAAKIQAWVLAHKSALSVSGLCTMLSVIVGLIFFGYVRAVFRKAGEDWTSALFFGGALVFASGGTLAAGLDFTFGDRPGLLSPSSLQLLNMIYSDFPWAADMAGLGLLYVMAGAMIRRSHVLPQWLSWVSFVLAALSASFVLGFIPLLAMALWAPIVGILLARRNVAL